MRTMANVKQFNYECGNFWFSPYSLELFNTKIESELIRDTYFITSEIEQKATPRKYTIRQINWDNGDIETVGNFQMFLSLKAARSYIKHFL